MTEAETANYRTGVDLKLKYLYDSVEGLRVSVTDMVNKLNSIVKELDKTYRTTTYESG